MDFQIPTMSCGHCVGVITKTLKAADPAAEMQFDLPHHRVSVQTSQSRETLAGALAKAGYAPA